MSIAYHLVSKVDWERSDPESNYAPAAFVQEGFIHCTDDPDEMAKIANLFYRHDPPPHLYLYIEKDRVAAPLRYDDAGRKYPHIYGSLNRDAIVAVREARRDGEGFFLPPKGI